MRAEPAALLGRLDRITVGLDAAALRDLHAHSDALRARIAAAAALPPRLARRTSAVLEADVHTLSAEILQRLATAREVDELAPVLPFGRPAARRQPTRASIARSANYPH